MWKMVRRAVSLLLLSIVLVRPGYANNKPYVILISFDGFRWDYLHRGLTPNLERMQRNGVTALSLQPVFPTKTFPNHLAIVTGMYPENHGIIFNRFRDPFSGKTYSLGDASAVRDPRWYLGEAFWETAERQGIVCASYFWPGSEMRPDYRHPTYFEEYEHNRPYEIRVDGVLKWLQLPVAERPHFITLYFDAVDSKAHRYGTRAAETDSAIARVDRMLGLLIAGLEKLGMLNQVNLIAVSDHGMMDTSPQRVIYLDRILGDTPCEFQQRGPVMMVQPKPGYRDEALRKLRAAEKHFRAFTREEVPAYWHFSNHPFISEIVVVAEPGWLLQLSGEKVRGRATHGWDNHTIDMHGIFVAMGPNFKTGYRTGTLRNIDIYPLLCKIMGIKPRQNIDGKLERIGFILR